MKKWSNLVWVLIIVGALIVVFVVLAFLNGFYGALGRGFG
jgi:hypothetical protein